ncbi:MAG: peptide chain release factor N(5)-glutamine methyltransferase [Phycisphaerales bacterium]
MPDVQRPTTAAEPWTTRRLLAWMQEAFGKHGIDSPRLCAEILIGQVLGVQRLKLYMDPDRPASAEELTRLRALVGRALKHEPVQYLVGEAWFYGLPFTVDRRVLIPRPCTEGIVEHVVSRLRPRRAEPVEVAGPVEMNAGEGEEGAMPAVSAVSVEAAPALVIADVCTGSGCIAVALARNLPNARVVATDVSDEALAVAGENAARHGVAERVEFRSGDLLGPLADLAGSLDALVANPPYIPDHEWDEIAPNVKDFEPTGALRAGTDGLQFVAPIIDRASEFLKPGGLLMVEIAASTADAVLALAAGHPRLANAALVKDLEGHQRFLVAYRR